MQSVKKRGTPRPNAGRWPKGHREAPSTVILRVKKTTDAEAALMKQLSPAQRLAVLLVAAKQEVENAKNN